MLNKRKIDRLSCEIATLIYNKYMIKAYGIKNCDINYTAGDLSEKIINKSLLDFGTDCEEFPRCGDRRELEIVGLAIPIRPFNVEFQGLPNPQSPAQATRTVVQVPARGSYQFVQPFPSSVWLIDFPLGFPPNITTVDQSGNEIKGAITYLYQDSHQGRVTISFSYLAQGTAYFS